jgi:hypothetical protein
MTMTIKINFIIGAQMIIKETMRMTKFDKWISRRKVTEDHL